MAKWAAKGVVIAKGDQASPEAFVAIAQVQDVSGPETTLEPLDVTTHDSTDGWKEFIGALLDGGEITLELFFDLAIVSHSPTTGLLKEQSDRSTKNYKITFPDGSTVIFACLVANVSQALPVAGGWTASTTLKTTGAPTWA